MLRTCAFIPVRSGVGSCDCADVAAGCLGQQHSTEGLGAHEFDT